MQPIENALTAALTTEPDRLVLYAQPVFTTTGRIAFEEILLRLATDSGLAMPGAFLNVVRQHRMDALLDRMLLRRVLASPVRRAVSVNINPASLLDPEVLEHCLALGQQQPLVVELLEDITNIERLLQARGAVERLRQNNIEVMVDDLGTGLSPACLALPVSGVKLAREWLLSATQMPRVLPALITGLRAEQLDVVVEGIESEPEREFLASKTGCTHFQGFLLSRPAPWQPTPQCPDSEALYRSERHQNPSLIQRAGL